MSTPLATAWMDRLAHDLRGPLAPMLTAVYLLRDSQTSEQQRDELLAVMERQIQRLGGMIDEVSDLGRAQKGGLVGRVEAIDVELLVADVVVRLQAVSPQVSFAPGMEGAEIDGDILRIGQLFRLLLGLQFSRHHPVPVKARLECIDSVMRMTCQVHCSNADDLMIASLLTLPHPEPPDDTLGLGLMIAAAIAEAHGGCLHGRASAADTAELLLELPARNFP